MLQGNLVLKERNRELNIFGGQRGRQRNRDEQRL